MNAPIPGIEGRIDIRFSPTAPPGKRVHIKAQRPLQATRLLENKSPEQVLEHIALLYSLCGEAQQLAARRALDQACGRCSIDHQKQQLQTDMESARELLMRLFADARDLLPGDHDLGMLPGINSLVHLMRQAETPAAQRKAIEQLESMLQQWVFARSSEDWLTLESIDELDDWISHSESPAARLLTLICDNGWASQGSSEFLPLPPLPAPLLLPRLDEDGYIAQPEWQGGHFETSSLTRQRYHPLIVELHREFGNGLLTRYAARLVELAALPGHMRQLLDGTPSIQDTEPLPPGQGLAQVEAARGRLVHAATVEGRRVTRYRILAPTEWNFHPRGPLARTLESLKAHNEEDWRMLAELSIRAIDPCVGYQLEVTV